MSGHFVARAALAFALLPAACSSSDGEATTSSSASPSSGSPSSPSSPSSNCAPYDASIDDTTTPASFATDIVPVLQKSCGLSSSCHASTRPPLLGPSIDAAAMRDGLVGRPSRALPTMPYVTPSKPEESFLLHKLDGDACMFDVKCTQGDCGDPMPLDGAPMARETRALIRRWIAAGARAD